MLNSAVSTYIIDIRKARKQNEWVNLTTDFSEIKPSNNTQEKWDIIDVLEQRLKDPQTFQHIRFGDRTAATQYEDSTPQIGMSEENAGLTTDNESTATHKTEWEIELERIVSKGYWSKGAIGVAKYLHFEVRYGENGDHFQIIKKGDPVPLNVAPEDKQIRTYNVVVIFPNDRQAKNGIAFFESRGSHSIVVPVRDLLKRAFHKMGDTCYVTTITPFAEKAAIKEAIQNNRVKKLRLLTEAPANEHGDTMEYESREIVYFAPRGPRLRDYLSTLVDSGLHLVNCGIKEISDFNPSAIKIEVNSPSGRTRTFTVGGSRNGIMQEPLEDVVEPDGTTNTDKFINKVEQIYKEQHIRT